MCDGYVCLPESQVCDGNFDCRDLLDEEGCTDEDEVQTYEQTYEQTNKHTYRLTH